MRRPAIEVGIDIRFNCEPNRRSWTILIHTFYKLAKETAYDIWRVRAKGVWGFYGENNPRRISHHASISVGCE